MKRLETVDMSLDDLQKKMKALKDELFHLRFKFATGQLDNWTLSHFLALGSERNGAKPWLGTIHTLAIYNRALKWWVRPVLAGGCHHVHMPVEQQWWCFTSPVESGDEVGAIRVLRHECGVQAGLRQQAVDVGNAPGFVARRIRRVEADELLQQLGRPLVYR